MFYVFSYDAKELPFGKGSSFYANQFTFTIYHLPFTIYHLPFTNQQSAIKNSGYGLLPNNFRPSYKKRKT